jgi:hypothetical protein
MLGYRLLQRQDIPTPPVRAVGGLVTVILLLLLIVGCGGQSAQEGGTPSEEAAVESAIRGERRAVDTGNFEKSYSYYAPNSEIRHRYKTPQEWVNILNKSMKGQDALLDIRILSLKVEDISGNTATATVDQEVQHQSGTYRYLVTQKLVKVDGQWKLGNSNTKILERPNEATSQSASATQSASASPSTSASPFVGRWQVSSSASASANDPFTVTITKEGEIYQVVLVRASGGASGTYVGRYDEADGSLVLEPDFCGDMSLSDDGDQLYWCSEVFTRVSQ